MIGVVNEQNKTSDNLVATVGGKVDRFYQKALDDGTHVGVRVWVGAAKTFVLESQSEHSQVVRRLPIETSASLVTKVLTLKFIHFVYLHNLTL